MVKFVTTVLSSLIASSLARPNEEGNQPAEEQMVPFSQSHCHKYCKQQHLQRTCADLIRAYNERPDDCDCSQEKDEDGNFNFYLFVGPKDSDEPMVRDKNLIEIAGDILNNQVVADIGEGDLEDEVDAENNSDKTNEKGSGSTFSKDDAIVKCCNAFHSKYPPEETAENRKSMPVDFYASLAHDECRELTVQAQQAEEVELAEISEFRSEEDVEGASDRTMMIPGLAASVVLAYCAL